MYTKIEELLETVFSVRSVLRLYSEHEQGKSCDRPTWSRFSMVSLNPRANAELVTKFHNALHASHTALPDVTSQFRTNVALRMLDHNFCIMQPFQCDIKMNSDHT
jgi:hypothetical protein